MITGPRKQGRAGNFLTPRVENSPPHLISRPLASARNSARASPARRTVKRCDCIFVSVSDRCLYLKGEFMFVLFLTVEMHACDVLDVLK